MSDVCLKKPRVLVLNKNWEAISIHTLEKAMGLLMGTYKNNQPKAVIIDVAQEFQTFSWNDWSNLKPNEGENVIRGVKREYKFPNVILLTRYDKNPSRKVTFSRRALYKRDGYKCAYCGDKLDGSIATIDHIIPRSQSGRTTWENCVCCCFFCNVQKANKRPEEAFRHLVGFEQQRRWRGPSPMKLLVVPTKPEFQLLKTDRFSIPKDWKMFLKDTMDYMYWNIELENDND